MERDAIPLFCPGHHTGHKIHFSAILILGRGERGVKILREGVKDSAYGQRHSCLNIFDIKKSFDAHSSIIMKTWDTRDFFALP
jgi:hypothetical protein